MLDLSWCEILLLIVDGAIDVDHKLQVQFAAARSLDLFDDFEFDDDIGQFDDVAVGLIDDAIQECQILRHQKKACEMSTRNDS